METFTYDRRRKSLIIFENNKPVGGLIGKIAEKKYKKLSKLTVLKNALKNGRKKRNSK